MERCNYLYIGRWLCEAQVRYLFKLEPQPTNKVKATTIRNVNPAQLQLQFRPPLSQLLRQLLRPHLGQHNLNPVRSHSRLALRRLEHPQVLDQARLCSLGTCGSAPLRLPTFTSTYNMCMAYT